MSEREILIDSVVDLLEVLAVPPYNTNPRIVRGMVHWVDTIELPALIVDEGEPESVEYLDFTMHQATMDLLIVGRLRGEWEDANELVEDIRKVMDSSSNTYREQMELTSVRVSHDIDSDRKEIEMHYSVKYWYTAGSA